jgi:hopanoid biosynthesis associated RND transporter like protein HpnN
VSVTFAVLFIGLGVDFGIHFSMRVLESVREGEQPEHALAGAARTTGTSLVLCAITTAIGFYAFLPTSYAGVAELGAISGTGMFLSLIATLTLLPALLALRPGALQAAARRRAARTSREAWLPTRRPKIVLGATAAAVVLALLALPGVRFDASPLGVRDPNAESVQAMRDLLESSRTSPWPIEFLAGDLDAARSLSQQLGALPEVDRTVTVLDFVPENQDEKLEILSDITLFLGALHSPSSVPASVERTGAALRRLEEALLRYERSASEPALAASAERLRRATERTLVRIEQAESAPEELQRIEAGMLGPLPALVAGLDVALSPGRVELDDLPLDLRARYMSADGQVRVQVFPTADLGDSAGLVEFVDAVRVLVPDASGSAVTIVESSRAIVGSLRWALGTATIAIGVLLLVMWRRIATTALVLAPLALAALLTTAGSVIVGPPFNFANVIVLPLLLGMGIDSGIHLVSRFEEGVTTDLLRTSTARAVLYSALTTAGSFGTLGLASHQGMASLGQLLTYGMIFTLLANLVVLPALLMTWRRTGGSA